MRRELSHYVDNFVMNTIIYRNILSTSILIEQYYTQNQKLKIIVNKLINNYLYNCE